MWYLKVSYNCGVNYITADKNEDPEKLIEKGEEFNKKMLRWYIEDDKGDFYDVSKIHKSILDTLINQEHS